MSRIANVLAPVAPAPGALHWTFDRPALLSVQLLGQLKVRVGDVAVDGWPSGRGRSLFKYLVTHRNPGRGGGRLRGAFWPEAPRASARNSLNVAVHGLRRAFRDSAGVQVVVL